MLVLRWSFKLVLSDQLFDVVGRSGLDFFLGIRELGEGLEIETLLKIDDTRAL